MFFSLPKIKIFLETYSCVIERISQMMELSDGEKTDQLFMRKLELHFITRSLSLLGFFAPCIMQCYCKPMQFPFYRHLY